MAPVANARRKRKAEGGEAGTAPTDLPAGHGTLLVKLGTRKGMERAQRLIAALKFLFPGVKATFPSLGMRTSAKELRAVLVDLTDSPEVQEAADFRNLENHAFLAALLDFAQDAAGVAAAPRASEVALTLPHRDGAVELSSDALYRLGLYHDAWPLPLTAEGISASNHPPVRPPPLKRRMGRDAAEDAADGGAAPQAALGAAQAEEAAAPPPVQAQAAPAAEQQQPAAPQEAPPGEGGDGHRDVPRRAAAMLPGAYAALATDDEGEDVDVGSPEHEDIDVGFPEHEDIDVGFPRDEDIDVGFPEHEVIDVGMYGPPSQPSAAVRRLTAARPSSAGGRSGSRPHSSLLTEEEQQSCYWLRRTGVEAAWYGTKEERDSQPTAVKKQMTSCHDCQSGHVAHQCRVKGCKKSYCQKCCQYYEYLFDSDTEEMGALRRRFCAGECPCCLHICVKKNCLRVKSAAGVKRGDLPPAPAAAPADRRIMALHAATCLLAPAQTLLADAAREAARQGATVAAAKEIPQEELNGFRLLCNRCATTMENVMMHCSACEVDICPRCCAELAGPSTGALPCPACLKPSTTSLQRALTTGVLAQLKRADDVVAAALAKGDAAATAYDYDCKLWRLTTPADATGRAVPRESCLTLPNGGAGTSGAATVANGGAGTSGLANGGGGVLSTVVVQPPAGPSSAAALDVCGRLPPGPRAALETELDAFFQVSNGGLQAMRPEDFLRRAAALALLPPAELPGGLAQAVRDAKAVISAMEQQQVPALDPPPPAPLPGTLVGPLPLPPRSLAPIPGCIDLVSWHKGLPPQDYRLAAARPSGEQNRVWTPHVSDFAAGSPRRAETVQRFVERWAAGEAIIVRGVRGQMNWGPAIVMRAARDMAKGQKDLDVIDCSDWSSTCAIPAEIFFREYTACHGPASAPDGRPLRMLKLRDFPPDDSFASRCVRHNADFIEMLNACMPEYMHPGGGALNLASQLPAAAVPPDLGPKGYIAFGREEEHEGEGDSVTRMHEDLSDAINVMCHVQRAPGAERGPHPPPRCGDAPHAPPSYGGAGAVWDLFRRQDIPMLRRFLLDVLAGAVPNCPPFIYKGAQLGVGDVTDLIHDQSLMLTAGHRAAMAREPYCLHPWVVEQYEHEAVLIPAACVHQVRNLRASIKIALDFVSPESVGQCLAQREERRHLARAERQDVDPAEVVEDRHFHDKLQVANMVVHGLRQAVDLLEKGEK